jgi:PAS domain S-box-containing protein
VADNDQLQAARSVPSLDASSQQLPHADALLRATLEATNDGILVTDAAHNVLIFNKQFAELWRLPDDVARNHEAIVAFNSRYFADPRAFIARAAAIHNTGDETFDELRLTDGRIYERFSRVQTLNDKPIGRVWNVRDVTKARQLEEAQARLVTIVESAEDAIIGKTLTSVITSWNEGAERIFGYSAEEAIGNSIRMLIPSERQSEEDEILKRLNRGERIEHYQTERVKKDGARITVSISVSPVKDSEGNVIGAAKIARDISDQRRAEEVQGRLAAIVESSEDAIVSKTLQGIITSWNSAAERLFGYTAEEAVGNSILILFPPEHAAEETEIVSKISRGERIEHYQAERVRKDGTRITLSLSISPIKDSNGKIIGASKIARDITHQIKHQEEREALLASERAARSEAERASQLKDEFLATLSHELRTPLNAILGWSQLLGDDPDDSDLREGLEAIQRNARAQTQLIEDLLDMSRIISGKVRLDIQSTDLLEIIDAAFEAVRLSAEAKGIRLRKILDFDAGPVSGDPTRLQQVVWNLLSNAIKFTPKGGKVDVLLERVNSHLEITVHDSGIGIKPEFLPSVFERFRQADASTTRNYGGLGLGLSIVKHLVELHGGVVRAKSAGEGLGATFIVSLPAAPIRGGERREHPKAPSASAFDCQEVSLAGIRVLLVDDEPDARALISRLLTQCRAEVMACATADEGLAAVQSFMPNVVISDIGMPGKDGYQFVRELRQIAQAIGQKFPAVALTAFARSEDRTRAMMAGYQVHIAKPIEPQELLATVGSLAGRTG